jgi:pimeloyl-ACP methyl ester carboxylesterase
VAIAKDWEQRIGNQRDWVWRGWQARYTFLWPPECGVKEKPPLIFLHGFGACIEHWRHNLPVLSQQHPVYALDLLGFGASRKVSTDYTVDLWVQQVYDFWRSFIRHPVVLVGNSIGSLVCVAAAATYPEMVCGVALVNLPDVSLRQEMLPRWLLPTVTALESLIASPLLLKLLFQLLRRPSIVRLWANIAYPNRSRVTEELVDILATPAQDEGAATTFAALGRAVNRPDFSPSVREILPSLAIPMLLLWGSQDRMVPPSLAPRFAQLNPLIQWLELAGAGHCPHDECPDEFNSILLDWLKVNFE